MSKHSLPFSNYSHSFLFLPSLSELALPGAAVPYVTFRSATSNSFVYLFSVRESFLYPSRPGA